MSSVLIRSPLRLSEAERIEKLLLEISARFIGLPADAVDSHIQDVQRKICEFLGLDRSTLWQQPLGDHQAFLLTHTYQSDDAPTPPRVADAQELFPWLLGQVRHGETTALSCIDELPPEAARDLETFRRFETKSTLVVPVRIGGMVAGALSFATVHEHRDWEPKIIPRLQLLAQMFGDALDRARSDRALRASEEQLRRALEEASRLRGQLQQHNTYLQQEVRSLSRHARVVGQSEPLLRVLAQVELVAPTSSNVLLLGETGTGKEVIASEIHELSPRRERGMVRVNCSAIPPTLIESELFGREKGAYTGALSKQIGRFEMANGSTLFLDEIGELPIDIQVKLLRTLEQRQVERLGSPKPIPVDARLIVATNQDLEKLVLAGKFRQDLYYRLNVFPITLPPLRERLDDLVPLVSAFVNEFSTAFGKNIESIAKESMEALHHYAWPGNVRELRNIIERAMIVARGPRLWIELPGTGFPGTVPSQTMRDVERVHILRVLGITQGRIRGKGGAAEILQLKPTTLESRMQRLGIEDNVRLLRTK